MQVQNIEDVDALTFRKTLGHFASGVTIITTAHEEKVHGMTANSFCSVSLNPPLVLISMDNRSTMHKLLARSKRYGVNILSRNQEALSRHFAGRPQEGISIPFAWYAGCPLIEGAVAQLVCTVVDEHLAGDHTLYIGHVEGLGFSDDLAPLLFYGGIYHSLNVQIRDYTLLNDPSWW